MLLCLLFIQSTLCSLYHKGFLLRQISSTRWTASNFQKGSALAKASTKTHACMNFRTSNEHPFKTRVLTHFDKNCNKKSEKISLTNSNKWKTFILQLCFYWLFLTNMDDVKCSIRIKEFKRNNEFGQLFLQSLELNQKPMTLLIIFLSKEFRNCFLRHSPMQTKRNRRTTNKFNLLHRSTHLRVAPSLGPETHRVRYSRRPDFLIRQ